MIAKNKFISGVSGVFIIAEVGSNFRMGTYDRDLSMALKLIDIAADSGVNAVKFQSFNSSRYYAYSDKTLSYLNSDNKSLNDIVNDLELSPDFLPRLAEHCKKKSVMFLSTPFSVKDFKLIEPYVDIVKVASYEINHVPLLTAIAKSGKSVILSTGASELTDIEYAISILRQNGSDNIALLQCTAAYPANPNDMNLLCMQSIGEKFSLPFGLSDHSEAPTVAPVMATTLGASVIEKHFTLNKDLPGPDHSFSVNPEGLKMLVNSVRLAESMMGVKTKKVRRVEKELFRFAKRALHATKNIKKGETLVLGINYDVLRPGYQTPGAHPRHLDVNGKKALADIDKGVGIQISDVG